MQLRNERPLLLEQLDLVQIELLVVCLVIGPGRGLGLAAQQTLNGGQRGTLLHQAIAQ